MHGVYVRCMCLCLCVSVCGVWCMCGVCRWMLIFMHVYSGVGEGGVEVTQGKNVHI